MNEANIDVVLDPDITKEGEATAQRSAIAAAEDRLPTTRLPPIAPPPLRPPSVPPGALPPSVVVSSRNTPTVPPQSGPAPLEATTRFRAESSPQAKPSWFRALLTTTSPPPALEADPHSVRRSVAVGCVVAACAFAVIALSFAFRAPPSLGTQQPVVAATMVLAHALLALGAGALSYGLLRIAERLSSTRVDPAAGIGQDV
jgi:hypothetical protein